MQQGQVVLRSLEAAVGAMREATLQYPGTSAKATLPAKKGRKRRQQPKRRRSYELAMELLSSSSEPMTVAEIQRGLSKQGQEFAHQTIVYGLDKLVDAGKAKRRKAKGRVRYRAIPLRAPGDPCGILAQLRCRDFKVAVVEVHHHAERRLAFGAADQLRVALQNGAELGVVDAGRYVSRQITERRACLGIEHDDRVGGVGVVRRGA